MTADLRDQLPAFEAAARRLARHDLRRRHRRLPARRPRRRPHTRPEDRVIRLTDLGRLPNAVWTMRRGRGLTQQQLGDKAGVTGMAVSLLELGKNGCKLDTLIRIADALGYDLALIPREDPAQPRYREGEQPTGHCDPHGTRWCGTCWPLIPREDRP